MTVLYGGRKGDQLCKIVVIAVRRQEQGTRLFARKRALACVITSLCLVVPGGGFGGSAKAAGRDAKPWTRIEVVDRYSFEGDVVEGKDLSGLAFVSDRFGLLGADEARQVQVVEMVRPARTLRVVETIYVASFRLGNRYRGDRRRCGLLLHRRLPWGGQGDGCASGQSLSHLPAESGPGHRPAEDPAGRRCTWVRRTGNGQPGGGAPGGPVLGPHFGKPLQRRGVNIEGLAARQGQLYIGFRGPNLGGDAFVLEIRADDVFSGKPQPAYTLHRLRLGEGLGIRELVAAKSSFLIIAGNAGSEPSEEYAQSEDYDKNRDFFLFRWDGKDPAVQKIGTLPKTEGQAEAMAVLEETKDSLTVLILFDGPKGGRPTIYRIS